MNIKIFYSETRRAIRQTKNIKDWTRRKREERHTTEEKTQHKKAITC
jgi:hypothetical protein